MTAELYENFLDIEMNDEAFLEFEELTGRDKPRLLKDLDVPIVENRIDYLKANKPINFWWYCGGLTLIILLITDFEAPWWGWLLALYFFSWGISAVGAVCVVYFKHEDTIAELERQVRWKKWTDTKEERMNS